MDQQFGVMSGILVEPAAASNRHGQTTLYMAVPRTTLGMRVLCRVNYHLATPSVGALARREHIYKEQKFSDHAPITIDYDWRL